MGYATLDAALGFPNNLPPNNSNILITDTLKSDANFLIHHFVINHLKNNKRVVLVGLSHIFNHYFLIGRKLGIHLQNYKQSNQLVFIDGLTHLNEYSNGTPYPPSRAPTAPTDTLDYTKDLKELYHVIKKHCLTTTADNQENDTLLILDDLSVLLYNGFDVRDVSNFILKLRNLMQQSTLLTLIHANEEGTDDVEQDNFVKQMIYGSNLILQVNPINSGLAKDVHGELDIIYGPQHYEEVTTAASPVQTLHYKILDNNVHFFAKGVAQV